MGMHCAWNASMPDFLTSCGKYWLGGLSLIWRLVLPLMKARFAMSSASRLV